MTGRLFNRKVSVTLARPQAGHFFKWLPNAIAVSDLRITFSITKTLNEKPNDATVSIFNLAPATRAEFNRKPLRIILEAGYAEDTTAQLFSGDLRYAATTPDGVNMVTKFQMGDGDRAFNFARISKSYKGGVSVRQAVKDVSNSMGLRIPRSLDDISEMGHQFTEGLTLEGASQAQMTKLLRSRGFGWSVQDGSLQILRDGGAREGQAVLVSEETGMISSPEMSPPKEAGKPPTCTGKMLLNPQLTPGGKIKVVSKEVNGIFRMVRVQHTGDTEGPDWFSSFEATPV